MVETRFAKQDVECSRENVRCFQCKEPIEIGAFVRFEYARLGNKPTPWHATCADAVQAGNAQARVVEPKPAGTPPAASGGDSLKDHKVIVELRIQVSQLEGNRDAVNKYLHSVEQRLAALEAASNAPKLQSPILNQKPATAPQPSADLDLFASADEIPF